MASQHSPLAFWPRHGAFHGRHLDEDLCPLCDQAIPHDRADEIAERLRTREQEQSAVLTARLRESFELEKVEALEATRLQAEEKIALAADQARHEAEARSRSLVDQAEQARLLAEGELQVRIEQATIESQRADAAQASLQAQLSQVERDGQAALDALRAQTEAREAAIREEAHQLAEAATADRLAQLEGQKSEAETTGAALRVELAELQAASERALNEAMSRAAAREAEVSAAAAKEAEEQLDQAARAQAAAEAKAAAAEARAAELETEHIAELNNRLAEQRAALEADKVAAINLEKSATFEERQKLANKVDELSRALEKKTAEELGEGAEIDLYEALKAEFPDDKIERVSKGQAGADILHTVRQNGQVCGTIIYDSKNHNAWRNDFVSKLRSDQLAAKADHAILSSSRFPAGARQLHMQDGVAIACPARVVVLAGIVRGHLLHTHTLRMSNSERSQKTAALYAFITSQQCADMLARLEEQANTLLEIQRKEIKAHEAVWKQQGIAILAAIKVQGDLRFQIDSIIGTASATALELQ